MITHQLLLNYLTKNEELVECICKLGDHDGTGKVNCKEKGRISWSDNQSKFIHIRFDDCVCSDFRIKKCDCIILRTKDNSKPIMFVIETKGNTPSLSEVKAQIETGLEKMIGLLPEPKNQFMVFPILCTARRTAFMKEQCLNNKVKIFGKQLPILILLYDENINNIF
jgi:hypothetical protein